MRRYRLTPQFVEAEQVSKETADAIAAWTGGLKIEEKDAVNPEVRYVGVTFPTLQGNQRASEGDYVVKGTAGAFKVMRKREFESMYEPI